jgi:ferredoxin--NADP+ reductase
MDKLIIYNKYLFYRISGTYHKRDFMEHNTLSDQPKGSVAVVGAGPAGLYAAKHLAQAGVQVALINRDIKLGGLAEYGIFHNKHKMKNGLRKQFHGLMEDPNIHYYGNVVVGEDHDLSLDELRRLGFSAVMVTVGAQGTKWLGLPGEDLKGVYHAKDLVYHYNLLPPYSEQSFLIGDRVVIVGMGNVMMDISNYMIRDMQVKEVTAIARRGPADVKFTKKEMAAVIKNLDMAALDAEIERTKPVLEAVRQDPLGAKDYILSALQKAEEPVSDTNFKLQFLVQPKRILGDEKGRVKGLEVEETTIQFREDGESTKAISLGTSRVIECDTVVFSIGDRVDKSFGLPLDKWGEFAKNPKPRFPVADLSYEAYDPETGQPLADVFLAGWAREASSGLVGAARKDGENGAKVLLQYLETSGAPDVVENPIAELEACLNALPKPVIHKAHWFALEQIEQQKAEKEGLENFKFATNEEMFRAIGLLETA